MRRHFGRRGELFQLHFEGRHRVESGFTSLVLGDTLRGLQALGGGTRPSRKQAALSEQSWLAFLQHIKGGTGEGLWPTPSLPFLFAGAQGGGLAQELLACWSGWRVGIGGSWANPAESSGASLPI